MYVIKILNFYQILNFTLSFLFNKKFNEVELIKKNIEESSNIFDIGSNLGNYIRFLTNKLTNFDLEFHSFEPIENLLTKQETLKINNKHKLKLNNTVVSNSSEEIMFYENSIPSQSTVKNTRGRIGKTKKSYLVKSIKLDQYCIENNINEIGYVKIDVEGSELSVLKSANELLKNKKINLIKVEITNTLHNCNEILDYMGKFDYKIASIDNLFFTKNYLNLLEIYFEKN